MASTNVLFETHVLANVAVTLVLVIRGGLRLGEYLDVTGSRATLNCETSPRTLLPIAERTSANTQTRIGDGRYVACIVSFLGSQSSPFFQRRSVTATIFRARVSFASSRLMPRATHAS